MNIAIIILCSIFLDSPIDSGISPSGFLLCDVEDFDGLTKFGKKQILKISTEVKGINS